MYTVFKRAWWKRNPSWPGGLEPNPTARKTKLAVFDTEREAREYCRRWNLENDPGKLSIKAEYQLGSI